MMIILDDSISSNNISNPYHAPTCIDPRAERVRQLHFFRKPEIMIKSSANLQFTIARDSPIAVVFRRGPRAWTQLIKWDLRKDRFQQGQWLKGRVMAERSNLSPTGKYLIYFAGDWRRKRDVGPTWTAISRPPYFTALALWEGLGTWEGGGYFIDDRHIVLDAAWKDLEQGYHLPKEMQVSSQAQQGSQPSEWIYGNLRLNTQEQFCRMSMSHRSLPNDRAIIHGVDKTNFKDHYYFIRQDGEDIFLEGCTCLEADHNQRTLIAANGKLYALDAKTKFTSLSDLKPLADFNGNTPESVECPKIMQKW